MPGGAASHLIDPRGPRLPTSAMLREEMEIKKQKTGDDYLCCVMDHHIVVEDEGRLTEFLQILGDTPCIIITELFKHPKYGFI